MISHDRCSRGRFNLVRLCSGSCATTEYESCNMQHEWLSSDIKVLVVAAGLVVFSYTHTRGVDKILFM